MTFSFNCPMYNATSHHRKGWGSPDVMEHSPGLLRKKTATYMIHFRQLLRLVFCLERFAKV